MKNFIMILCVIVWSGCSETTSTRSNSQSTTENSPSSEDGSASSDTETSPPGPEEPEGPAFLSLTPVTEIKRWKHSLLTKNLEDLTGPEIKVESSACSNWIKAHFINRCHRARYEFLSKKDSIEAILKRMSEQMIDSLFRGGSTRTKLTGTYSHHKNSIIEMFRLGFQEAFENKTQPLSKETTSSGGVDNASLLQDPKHQSFVQTCTQAGLDHKYTPQWCEVLKKTFPEEEADPYQNEENHSAWWN